MSRPQSDKPLIPLTDLPVPKDLAGLLGYVGGARFVALIPGGPMLELTDGRVDMEGEGEVWRLYAAHPAVRAVLGTMDGSGGERLLLDRQLGTVHRGASGLIERFLKEQWLRHTQAQDYDSTGQFERTLDGLQKAVELMGDTSLQARLDRKEMQHRRVEAMKTWLAELA